MTGKLLIILGLVLTHLGSSLSSAAELSSYDNSFIEQGKKLFNLKAVCFGCHGINGDTQTRVHSEVSHLNPKPADLRKPSDRSPRQLYFIVKYGIPGTAMVGTGSVKTAGMQISDEEVISLISYILALRGSPLSVKEILVSRFNPDSDATILVQQRCEAEGISNEDVIAACENRFALRLRDLFVGKPADIPSERYQDIQASCGESFGQDLDRLARCYRMEYTITRASKKPL